MKSFFINLLCCRFYLLTYYRLTRIMPAFFAGCSSVPSLGARPHCQGQRLAREDSKNLSLSLPPPPPPLPLLCLFFLIFFLFPSFFLFSSSFHPFLLFFSFFLSYFSSFFFYSPLFFLPLKGFSITSLAIAKAISKDTFSGQLSLLLPLSSVQECNISLAVASHGLNSPTFFHPCLYSSINVILLVTLLRYMEHRALDSL